MAAPVLEARARRRFLIHRRVVAASGDRSSSAATGDDSSAGLPAVTSGPAGAQAWLPHGGVVVLDDGTHEVVEPG